MKDKSFFKANNYRFSVDLLYSNRIKETGNFVKIKNYAVSDYEKLNDFYGYHIDFCVAINPAKTFFVGALYNNLKSETVFKNVDLTDNGGISYINGNVTRKIEMNTVGLKGMFLFPSKRAFNNLYLQLGFNLTNYNDEYFTTKSYLSFQSMAYSPFIGLSYDFRLQKHLAVGFNAMLELGSIQEINSNQNGQLRTYNLAGSGLSILRITNGIGLKYYFGK